MLINNLKPITDEEKREVLLLNARENVLSGNIKNALQSLLNTSTINKINVKDDDDTKDNKESQNNDRLYMIARSYALQKKDDLAFATLKSALDSGFYNKYVLNYDNAWERFRDSPKFEKLFDNYSFRLYIVNPEIDPIGYRIPNGNFKTNNGEPVWEIRQNAEWYDD